MNDGTCRTCGQPLELGRRAFCSRACREAWRETMGGETANQGNYDYGNADPEDERFGDSAPSHGVLHETSAKSAGVTDGDHRNGGAAVPFVPPKPPEPLPRITYRLERDFATERRIGVEFSDIEVLVRRELDASVLYTVKGWLHPDFEVLVIPAEQDEPLYLHILAEVLDANGDFLDEADLVIDLRFFDESRDFKFVFSALRILPTIVRLVPFGIFKRVA